MSSTRNVTRVGSHLAEYLWNAAERLAPGLQRMSCFHASGQPFQMWIAAFESVFHWV
jgi:hypothetical protein